MNDGSPTPPLEVIIETLTILNSQVGETTAPPPASANKPADSTPQVAPTAPSVGQTQGSAPQVAPPASQNAGETEFFQSELHLPAPENPNRIGPFGWVGIVFLCCLFFACVTNIYLKRQKKGMETAPPKAELAAMLKNAGKA